MGQANYFVGSPETLSKLPQENARKNNSVGRLVRQGTNDKGMRFERNALLLIFKDLKDLHVLAGGIH